MSFCLRPNVCKKCGKPLTMFEGWICLECEKAEQEPCGDLISRQAVDEIKELMTDINGNTVYAVRMSDIRHLPSVNPQEPKTDVLDKIKVEIRKHCEHYMDGDIIAEEVIQAVENIVRAEREDEE